MNPGLTHRSATMLIFATAIATGCADPPRPTAELDTRRVEVHGHVLELVPARLFAPGYAHFRLVDDRLVQTSPRFPERCYWDGRVVDHAGSRVAVRACEADFSDLTGAIIVDQHWFVSDDGLEPMRGRAGRCGVDDVSTIVAAPEIEGVAPTPTRTRRQALSSLEPRFIEVLAVEDSALIQARDRGELATDTVLAVHMAAALYDTAEFADRIVPLLVAHVETGGSDPWGQPPTSGGEALSIPYLGQFNVWLASSNQLPDHDQATLFTGWDLDGLTVGIATVDGACDPEFSGAIVNAVDRDDRVAATTAHELGHTLGMGHDGEVNDCPQSGFIMAWITTEGDPGETRFSNCSLDAGNRFLASDAAWCIGHQAQPAHGGPNCGDGKVDAGEQCDCGPAGCAGRDPCCDEATCQLRSGATCSVIDGCCDASTCTPFDASANVECRAALSSCDVAEVCDGGARCPIDRYVAAGAECVDDAGWTGACLTGRCVTRGGICEALADDYILDPVPYDPMCADAGCDVMECVFENACVYTSFGTPNGTPCGAGRQCWLGTCAASSSLPGADGCSDPDLDTDGDGTRDCDDACPLDASATAPPCAVVEPDDIDPDVDPDRPDAGEPADPDDDDGPIVILPEEPASGCSTAPVSQSWPLLLILGGLALRTRRRDS